MSFYSLIMQASFLVKIVMLILVGMSVLSWWIIFYRGRALKAASEGIDQFENRFWSGIDLGRLYQEMSAKRDSLLGLEHIFYNGFRDYLKLHKSAKNAEDVMTGAYRGMRVACSREVDKLEEHLTLLATIGSISPYIGLFGTVWGIMNAFIALGEVEQATLSMVAPGIAEALIATAMGLFAAIPAVVMYNKFSTQVVRLENGYQNFMEEFSSILHRQAVAELDKA